MHRRIHEFLVCDLPRIARMIYLIEIALIAIVRIKRHLVLLINQERCRVGTVFSRILIDRNRKKFLFPIGLEADLRKRIICVNGRETDIAAIPVTALDMILINRPVAECLKNGPCTEIVGTFNHDVMGTDLQRRQVRIVITFTIDRIDAVKMGALRQLENNRLGSGSRLPSR